MKFSQYIVVALLPLLVPSIVWIFKLWLVERYTFLYGDEKLKGPYLIVRLDRLTGKVHCFDWVCMGPGQATFGPSEN